MRTKQLLTKMLLVALCLIGGSGFAWAQTTWTFKDNNSVWAAVGDTLKGGNQYDKDANSVNSGGVTFTGTSGFVSTAKGIGFYTTGSTSDENISIVVPVGFKAVVSILTASNRTVVASFGGTNQTFNANWASSTKEFNNALGTTDITLYLYCNQNAGGADQKKAPFLESIELVDMASVSSYPWSANAVATINETKTIIKTYESTSDVDEGSNYTVVVDKAIKYGNDYYQLSDAQFNTNVYGKTFTMGNVAGTHEFTYEKINNCVFYGEVEDIYTSGSNANKSTDTQLSNGEGYNAMAKAGYVRVTFNVPAKGVYNIVIGMNNTNGSDRGFNYSIDGAAVSETITVSGNSAYVQNINNQLLASGDHTITLNITYSLTPVFDYVLVTQNNADDIYNAIVDCETYENSAEFATYIEGLFNSGNLSSVNDVYANHSAWQIAQAQTNGSTDYSKAIMNRDFELGTIAGWTIYGDPASTESEERNNGKIDATYAINGSYSYYTGDHGRNVSQNIATLPAGVYQLTAHVGSWSGGAPVRLFANGTLSAAENGDDHTPSLIFTVTGTEESIKIGIGGTGNNNDTDNTWGTWGYRVDNFTLTKIENVSKTITSAGWATYCSPYILDFTNDIENLTDAYIVTGGAGGKLVTSSVKGKKVPANTGLLLKGLGACVIPVATTSDEISGNQLTGVTAETQIAAEAGYVLMDGTAGVAFYKNLNAFTVGANTAYLPANFDATTPGARAFFSFGDDATDIRLIENGKIENSVYDLQGRRIDGSRMNSGIYIHNGRKVVVK